MDWKSVTSKDDGAVSIPKRWLHIHYYEALNILFRMENALRVFVYAILKNEYQEKWADATVQISDEEQSTIAAVASKRIAQNKGFGYLGYEINSPLMHLNSGELTRLITSDTYWKLFQPYFRGKREIIRTKLDEVGTVRNSLAHFRPIKYDDIELIKQNIKHAFVGIEESLTEMTNTYKMVPTNTEEDWYRGLITLRTELCELELYQSRKENWVRIKIGYSCSIFEKHGFDKFFSCQALNLISSSVVKHFHKLASLCTYVTEEVPPVPVDKDINTNIKKNVSIVFSRGVVKEHHTIIRAELQELFNKIQEESELIKKDHLARGLVVDSVFIFGENRETEGGRRYWFVNTAGMDCAFDENDPPEYWGDIGLYHSDFIGSTSKFPWMPSDISSQENPYE